MTLTKFFSVASVVSVLAVVAQAAPLVAAPVTVSLVFNAGTQVPEATGFGATITEPDTTPTLSDGSSFSAPGYFVSGWSDTDDGTEDYEIGSQEFTIGSSNTTLYAVWSQHSVEYYKNAADATVTVATAGGDFSELGAADYVTSDSTPFTRHGFELVGWSETSGDAATVDYELSASLDLVAKINDNTNPGSIELYAVWEGGPSGGFSAPAPFDGPVITTDFSGDSFNVGQSVTISGTGLDGISSVRFGDTEASVSASESSASFVVPDVEPGQYTLTIESSNGSIGLQQQMRVLAGGEVAIVDEVTESKGWTSKQNVSQVKMYAKNIEVGSKYQFFVNGEEVAWVRKNSETDIEGSSLRAALGTDYMVRTVDLMPGKNALEVYIDGTRVWRAAYSG